MRRIDIQRKKEKIAGRKGEGPKGKRERENSDISISRLLTKCVYWIDLGKTRVYSVF